MEQYRQITFMEAMKMVNEDKLDNLYFETTNGIDNVSRWQVLVDDLPNKKWFIKERI